MIDNDSSVSEEFLKLYESGLMNPTELNDIRLYGLKVRLWWYLIIIKGHYEEVK